MSRAIYGFFLVLCGVGLARTLSARTVDGHLITIAALIAISVCGYCVTHAMRVRVVYVFDMGIALALVALVVAGPLPAFVVAAAPDLVHLARRRRAFWNLGLSANLASWAAAALVGAAVLSAVPRWDGAGLIAVGAAMTTVNYFCARFVLGAVRDGERPIVLIRREFLGALPLELAAVGMGVGCALLMPAVGIPVLVAFAALAYFPQMAAGHLLHAPSVAALTIDEAASVYRDALADEMRLGRSDRQLVHLIDALAQRRQLPDAHCDPLAAVQDALLVTICTARAPSQRYFSATTRTQVVLAARRWAQLTARCTPALSHREALAELRRSALVRDAPLALTAVQRIVEREAAFTEHVAGVPRLHRAPLPWALRHDVLPVALGRLAA